MAHGARPGCRQQAGCCILIDVRLPDMMVRACCAAARAPRNRGHRLRGGSAHALPDEVELRALEDLSHYLDQAA